MGQRGVSQNADVLVVLVDTPLCAPPSAQKYKFKFFTLSNVLGKEHYRQKVDKSSEYQPTPPELASSIGLKPKVSQYTVSAQNLLHTRAGVNSGIGIGIDTNSNSNSRNWNCKGIE